MKKVLALVMAIVMMLAFAACTNNNKPADNGNAGGADVKHKIGMIWYGNTDPMGGTFYAWANHAAELLNVELVWHLGDYTTEAELSACEQMISAGCEGVYFIPMDTAANLQLGNACKDAGVYWAVSNRDILDESIKEA